MNINELEFIPGTVVLDLKNKAGESVLQIAVEDASVIQVSNSHSLTTADFEEQSTLLVAIFKAFYEKSLHQKHYLLLNWKGLKRIGKKVEKQYKQLLVEVLEKGFFEEICVVWENTNINKPSAMKKENFDKQDKIKGFTDEKLALRYIHTKQGAKPDIYQENTPFGADWVGRDHIFSHGNRYELMNKNGWNITSEHFSAYTFLLNRNILILQLNGYPTPQYIRGVYRILRSILNFSKQKELYMIADFRGLKRFGIASRKSFDEFEEVYNKYWKQYFILVPPGGYTYLSFYEIFKPEWVKKLMSVEGIHQALGSISMGTQVKRKKNIPPKKQLMQKAKKATKKELLEMLEGALEDNIRIEHQIEKRIRGVLEKIGKLGGNALYENEATPASGDQQIRLQPQDPFYRLWFALKALQDDYHDTIRQEQREKNQLEIETVRQEAEIQQLESNLRNILDHDKDAIWLLNRRYEVVEYNKKFNLLFESYIGKTARVGTNILKATSDGEIRKLWKSNFDEAFQGKEVSFFITVPQKEGKYYYKILMHPLKKKERVVSQIAIFARNITDKVQAESLLEQSRSQLQLLLQQLPIILASFDKKLRCTSAIGKGLENFGISAEKMKGVSIYSLSRAYSGSESLTKVFQNGLKGKSGAYDQTFGKRQYLVYVEPLYDREGEIDGVVSLSMDISERKNAEDELKNRNAKLQKVNRELDQFVYSVSHDLRAPLASVSGLISIALDEQDPEQVKNYLRLQRKSVKRLDSFIKDIINLSRNSRMDLHKEKVDIEKVFKEIFEANEYASEAKKIEKRIHIEQEEPFFSDPRRLKVILSNIISNAIRYSLPNMREVSYVEVEVRTNKKESVFWIRDNGQGIQKQHLEKIFDMFYRATDSQNGSGLGLYIVRETLEKLNGTVEVNSTFGEGTEFKITLPNQK